MGIAAGMKNITQDIASSYEARIAEVGGVKTKAKEMLSSFQSSRREMSLALHKDLAGHTQSLRGRVAEMRQEIGASQQDMSAKLRKSLAQGAATLKSKTRVILNDFQRSHQRAGAQLRKDLASYDHGIKSKVSEMRQETLSDLREARTAWQNFARTRQAKTGMTEIPDLEAKMLTAVNEHPQGITLAGIADRLGVAPIVLGRAIKSLLDRGEIHKEKKLYFPVVAG